MSIDRALPTTRRSKLDEIPIAYEARMTRDFATSHVDASLPLDQIDNREMFNFYLQPLVSDIKSVTSDESVLYCTMAARLFFLEQEAIGPPADRRANAVRAEVCEVIAVKLLSAIPPEKLVSSMIYMFYPLSKGSTPVLASEYMRTSALWLAIKTEAKKFLSQTPSIQIVEEQWNGTLVYDPNSKTGIVRHSTSADLNDPSGRSEKHKAPKHRFWQQFVSAFVFLVLYLAIIQDDPQHINPWVESSFALWSIGYALEEVQQYNEFGGKYYFMSLWNWIDTILLMHVAVYGVLRLLSFAIPNIFPSAFMIARGVLITAGLFIVPRLFCVFDRSKVFSNMVFSLQKVSSDFIVSWFVVMMFSIGVWVSVSFSVPRVRIRDAGAATNGDTGVTSDDDNGGARTALAMFKMLFGETDSLWDLWFDLTLFDRAALCFYLFLAQFVVPTVVTAVMANSFANARQNSEEEYHYMRAVQTLMKLEGKLPTSKSVSSVPPLNVFELGYRYIERFVPCKLHEMVVKVVGTVVHAPSAVIIAISRVVKRRRSNSKRDKVSARRMRMQHEVDVAFGITRDDNQGEHTPTSKLDFRTLRESRFEAVSEVFTSEEVGRALKEHQTLQHIHEQLEQNQESDAQAQADSATAAPEEMERTRRVVIRETKLLHDRMERLEASTERLEKLLLQLTKQ